MRNVKCRLCSWRGKLTKIRTHMSKAHPGSLNRKGNPGVHRGRKGEVHATKSEAAAGFPHFCPICGRQCA